MKKNVIFLISAMLMLITVSLYAQNPYCKWDEKHEAGKVLILPDKNYYNAEEGCGFRFELKSPLGMGWYPGDEIAITVDGVDCGVVTLPYMTPSSEVIKLLPSSVVQFSWVGDFNPFINCFKIYNSSDEMIYESIPYLDEGVFLTYQNVCPDCTPLTNFEGEYIKESKQIHLSWVAPESEDLTGFDIFRNDILIEHVNAITNFYTAHTDSLEDGVYKYCVLPVYPFLCMFDDECYETYISNVGVKNYSSTIRLYPNPTNNMIFISGGNIATVKVFDIIGQLVNSYEKVNIVNVSSYKEGIYLFKITTTNGEAGVFKIVITE